MFWNFIKRNFKQGSLLLVAIGSQAAHAQWSDEARNYVDESVRYPFENSYLATAWDVFQIPSYKIATIPNTRIVSVPTPYLSKRSTRVIVHTAPNPKAPLVIINPGMFSNLENHQFTFDIKVFSDLGMHVILLPNPWDKDIIGGGVSYIPGDLQAEGQMLYEVAQATVRMQAARIQPTSIKLIGYSYGAFMSAVMTEIDTRLATPLFTAGECRFRS